MTRVRLASAVVILMLVGGTDARAQPALGVRPGSDPRAQDATDARGVVDLPLRGGDRLTIDTQQGSTLEGRLVSQGADALILDIGGHREPVLYSEIDRVRRRRNGVIVGAIVGLGVGLTFGIPGRMLVNNESGNGNAVLLTMVGLGVGTGLLVDGLLSVNRTIYRRSTTSVRVGVAPQIGGAAIRVTARW